MTFVFLRKYFGRVRKICNLQLRSILFNLKTYDYEENFLLSCSRDAFSGLHKR